MTEQLDGMKEMLGSLNALADGAETIGMAAVCGAAGAITKSIRSQAPPELREKVGFSPIPSRGQIVRAAVGFGMGNVTPRRTATTGRPNTQRQQNVSRLIQSGVNQGLPSASAAMRESAADRMHKILEER